MALVFVTLPTSHDHVVVGFTTTYAIGAHHQTIEHNYPCFQVFLGKSRGKTPELKK
jgi:hypothetical protein